MIRHIEIKGLRALRYVSVDLDRFQVLVGANASGKSTFFDAINLVGDILNVGLERAFYGEKRFDIPKRVVDARDLSWMREGGDIDIVLVAELPDAIRNRSGDYRFARYELSLSVDQGPRFRKETLWLCQKNPTHQRESNQLNLFPMPQSGPDHVVKRTGAATPSGWRKVVNKVSESGNDYFQAEISGWNNQFRLGPGKSALGNLPEDEDKFPAAIWLKRLLMECQRGSEPA